MKYHTTLVLGLVMGLASPALALPSKGKAHRIAKRQFQNRRRTPVRLLQPKQIPKLTRARFLSLAGDPAHGGKITRNSRREAVIGLTLEKRGILPAPIKREATGRSEFVDATGKLWDVKGFNSHFPATRGGFVLDRAMRKLIGQFDGGENVILDTAQLSRKHEKQLRREIRRKGFSDRVLFFP